MPVMQHRHGSRSGGGTHLLPVGADDADVGRGHAAAPRPEQALHKVGDRASLGGVVERQRVALLHLSAAQAKNNQSATATSAPDTGRLPADQARVRKQGGESRGEKAGGRKQGGESRGEKAGGEKQRGRKQGGESRGAKAGGRKQGGGSKVGKAGGRKQGALRGVGCGWLMDVLAGGRPRYESSMDVEPW
eukprot:357613-Chlamydomonas_euryale.AAC.2